MTLKCLKQHRLYVDDDGYFLIIREFCRQMICFIIMHVNIFLSILFGILNVLGRLSSLSRHSRTSLSGPVSWWVRHRHWLLVSVVLQIIGPQMWPYLENNFLSVVDLITTAFTSENKIHLTWWNVYLLIYPRGLIPYCKIISWIQILNRDDDLRMDCNSRSS